MSNKLNIDLTGNVVVLSKRSLSPRFHDLKTRLFHVDGGFGASPHTRGSKIGGYFLYDGERINWDGYSIDRLATQAEIDSVTPPTPCSVCGGRGLVEGAKKDNWTELLDCSNCAGSGYFPAEEFAHV